MSAMDTAGNEPSYDQAQPARYFGKYPGVVIGNGPPDGGGKHVGQIKARVPGILEETPDGTGNQPLEVIASPSFLPGFFFVPNTDDPIWVEFVAGDINFPIWTGVWYPSDNGAPQTFDGKDPTEKQKVIRTTSGHVIQLDDTSDGDAEKIVLKDKTGNKVTIHKDEIKLEGQNASVTLGSNDLTLKFNSTTVVIKDQTLELTSGSNSIKFGSDGISIEGAKVAISGSSQVTVNNHAVVLGPLITWLLSHQHVGNMGAPTPLFPADLAQLAPQPPTIVSKPGGG